MVTQIKRDAAISNIRADLEKEMLKIEKAAERLAGLAGTRFDERAKAQGMRDRKLIIFLAHNPQQSLFPTTLRTCTAR